MTSRETLYIAGPYTAPTPEGTAANIAAAVRFGQAARVLGFVPVVPHVCILPVPPTPEGYEEAMAECLSLMGRCDAVLLMPGWDGSPGACREKNHAEDLGIPVFSSLLEISRSVPASLCHTDAAGAPGWEALEVKP